MNIEKLKENFKKHVEQFDMSDTAIIRKYYHSLRVMDLSILLAKNNSFNESDIEISTLIGLLHDYARFEQWTKYKTYSDLKSIDHGDLGVKLLFDDNNIKNYTTNLDYYDEIKDAIENHNKHKIADKMSEHNRKLCEIVRDADKLDIFYLFGINKDLFKEDNKLPSKEVIKEFYEEKSIDRTKVKSETDNILLDLSMVYDLYYDYSYQYLSDQKLIDKMYDNIENKQLFKEYFDYIKDYIEKRIKNVR